MSLDAADRFTLAQSMWWMDKGPAVPSDPVERDVLWIRDSPSWLQTADELLRYLQFNGLDVVRTRGPADPSRV